jgi:FKBP-type peptidyl-prolyl cis-trans isomerase
MMQAFDDVLKNKNLVMNQDQCGQTLQQKLQEFSQKKTSAQKEKGVAFLNENKKRPGVIALPNGLQYEVLTAGDPNGMKPNATDTVEVHYVGTLIDGTEFDNSIKRGQTISFPLNGVIKGWTEILQLMTVGSKWKVYIPSELGYGERGAGGAIPGNSTLIFEIDLKGVKRSSK